MLDTASNTLGAPIQLYLSRLRGGFSWMALSPDGGTAYIANSANKALAVVALPSGQGDTLMPEVSPNDVAISPDGRTVYLAGCKPICTPGFVQLLDTTSKLFGKQIQIGGNPYRIAIGTERRARLHGQPERAERVGDRSRRQHGGGDRAVPVQPTGVAVSPDSRTVWVASQTGGMLTAIDAASSQVRASVPIALARDVVVTPDGRQVYVSSERAVVAIDPSALSSGR